MYTLSVVDLGMGVRGVHTISVGSRLGMGVTGVHTPARQENSPMR